MEFDVVFTAKLNIPSTRIKKRTTVKKHGRLRLEMLTYEF